MAVNHYFSSGFSPGTASEQDLYNQIHIEAIKIHGQDFYYCPREHVRLDDILKEDVLSSFNKNYVIEAMIENVEGYGENTQFLSKFGLYINKTIKLTMSRERFTTETGEKYPAEGALIYFPLGDALFEIKSVEDEIPFYQLGDLYVFTIVCELFSYSQEELNTGVADLDAIGTLFDNPDSVVNDPFASNDDFDIEATRILDRAESNPLGDPE